MIESLALNNWKSVEVTRYDFEPGLNFILGPNGRGKTSLLEGITFALFGRIRDSKAVDCIRHGASSARASVTVSLDGVDVIDRSIDSSGNVSVTLTRSRDAADSVDAHKLVESRLGADAAFLVNLVLLAEGDIYRYGIGPDDTLETHLETILPIQQLSRLRRRAVSAAKAAASPQRKRRESQRIDQAELEEKRNLLARNTDELDVLASELERVTQVMEPLISDLRQAELRTAQDEAYRSWLQSWNPESGGVSGDVDTTKPDQTVGELQNRLDEKLEDLRETTNGRSILSGEQSHVQRIVQSLQASRDICPTCGQSLTDEHRESVLTEQSELLEVLGRQISEADRTVGEIEIEVGDLRGSVAHLRSLLSNRPPKPSHPLEDVEAIAQQLQKSREAQAEARTRHLTLQEQIASLKAEVEQAERNRLVETEITEAFREEALWNVLSSGIEVFMAEARNSIIQPLVDELSRQWKAFRPNAPWTLDVDGRGHLCMVFEGTSYPFSALSGGEKAAALVLLRVALTRALTDVDFMLLDEPLEHMDPRSRRLLVSSLHQMVSKGMFKQILLTTYEEQLVRRFVGSGQAHAIYLD